MEENQVYTIKVNTKDHYIEEIMNQVDDLRFSKNSKHPTVEIIFLNMTLTAKEIYTLFDELVVHQGIVISKISFESVQQELTLIEEKKPKSLETIFIGDINEETVLVSPSNMQIIGVVRGTIILKNPATEIYAKKFEHANILIQDKSYYIEDAQNYLLKKD